MADKVEIPMLHKNYEQHKKIKKSVCLKASCSCTDYGEDPCVTHQNDPNNTGNWALYGDLCHSRGILKDICE